MSVAKYIVVSSFMRSGTHLTIDFIRLNFPGFDLPRGLFGRLSDQYIAIDPLLTEYGCSWKEKQREARKFSKGHDAVIKTHFTEPLLRNLEQQYRPSHCHFLYVVRDPFCVLKSLYVFEQSFRKREEFVCVKDWAREKLSMWCCHVRKHLEEEEILLIRFEDIIRSPQKVGEKIAQTFQIQWEGRRFHLPKKNGSRLRGWLARGYLIRSQSTEVGPKKAARALTADDEGVIRQEIRNLPPELKQFCDLVAQ